MSETNKLERRFKNSLLAGDRQDAESAIDDLTYAQSAGYSMVEFIAGCIRSVHEEGEELESDRVY